MREVISPNQSSASNNHWLWVWIMLRCVRHQSNQPTVPFRERRLNEHKYIQIVALNPVILQRDENLLGFEVRLCLTYFVWYWITDKPKHSWLACVCWSLWLSSACVTLWRLIRSVSLSHFPRQSETQVSRYAGHSGGNGADLIEWGGVHGGSGYH